MRFHDHPPVGDYMVPDAIIPGTHTGSNHPHREAGSSGRVINPMLFEGQVHGGIQMGLGYALSEEMAIDPETGTLKNPTFKKYRIFKAGDIPATIRVMTVENPDGKSIGECATDGTAGCVVNAASHALGVELRQCR